MKHRPEGTLRIIGGEWRRRIVQFDPRQDIRPTPDRVRETLFNWVAPWIEGARVLDLFSGAGALGLEALSRGAAEAVFVDRNATVIRSLRAALDQLGGLERASLRQSDAVSFLQQNPQHFDLIFIDPPYASELMGSVLPAAVACAKPHARLYLEWGGHEAPALPAGWDWHRQSRAGQVSYGLICATA